MSARSAIIEATSQLLAASAVADVSTRAVCEAAGVQQPVLYRLFGDKDGLLSATVDHAFEEYLASKRKAEPTEDPVDDIRKGWDAHTGFALARPNFYRLMFGPGLKRQPDAVLASHQLLQALVDRAGRKGRLLVPSGLATQMIMAANTGVALALITRPEIYTDRSVSDRVRDITLHGVFTSEPGHGQPDALAKAAATFASTIATDPPPQLSQGERVLMAEWMNRFTGPSSKQQPR
ncbi:TetR/AcrR family transcriptional regulator [Arthrobacter sp. efr-133-TYG-118]|uniref:TetR/AcrR family transcriptional regulator n=1 Tax=Arthrobacter sp. efr-133-TYG-118 TaxID=3040279 RepID=UPI00254EFCC0|nr:TetR/AcrR family transcriptional regulator [Arthrobacter sp. efr-133-TYG-118]